MNGPGRPEPSPGVGLLVVDHPVVAHRLTSLRQPTTDNATFRQLAGEISALVAYEALSDLGTAEEWIDTPVTRHVAAPRVVETVVLVPILRAGLGMVPAIQALLPLTEVAHVGLRRDEATLESSVYLNRLPADLTGRRVAICDPMLATGGSLATVCDMVFERGATDVVALCLLASVPGLAAMAARHPSVVVACAGVDPGLDHRGFIVPGLGDAGDRLFGPPD